MSQRVISYDPGGTTGYATFRRVRGSRYVLESWGEFETWTLLNEQVPEADLVIYEEVKSFHPSFNTVGIEVMGVIRALCFWHGIESRPRSPGLINGIMKWRQGKFLAIPTPHARDAVAHGVIYLGIDKVDLTEVLGV